MWPEPVWPAMTDRSLGLIKSAGYWSLNACGKNNMMNGHVPRLIVPCDC